MQPGSFVYSSWCFCATTGEMKVMTETMWPAKPKIFTIWLFTEKSLSAPDLQYFSVAITRRIFFTAN